MNQRAKNFVKAQVNRTLRFVGPLKAKGYNIENTIVLVASPRGGSTWLAEILNRIPGYSLIWEPLSLNEVPEAREIGFQWRTFIPPGTEWKEAEDFLRGVLTGKFLTLQTIQASLLREIILSKGLIVKFCRAHMFLKWMTEKFTTKTPILLIRHPCAVVASQMKHGRWKPVREPRVDPRFLHFYPQFSGILKRLTSWEEALAGTWCLEYFAPLMIPKPHPWLLVTYERLVREGEDELERIFKTLEIDMPEDAKKNLRIPSFTTKPGSSVTSDSDQLALWKRRLSKEQVKNILDAVAAFGLDFYTDELEPDYDRLYSDNPVRF